MTRLEPRIDRVTGALEKVARAIMASRLESHLPAARWQRLMPGKPRQSPVDNLPSSAIAEARAAIASYEAALRDAGLTVVPRMLTPEMTRIGALYCNGAIATRLMWEDIIAAAPR
jgi:hypothetical protein